MIRNGIRTLISYLKSPPIVESAREMDEAREEIEFHLLASTQAHIDSGMDSQKSQQEALERFGDVNTVVQDCCEVSMAQHVFWHRIHQGLTLILVCAVGALWYYTRDKPATNSDLSIMAASGYLLSETSGDISGTVVTDDGKPINAAHVLAVVKTWPQNGYRQNSYMATTRADGSFLIENVYPPAQDYEVQIAAIADDHVLKSEYISMRQGTLDPFRFQVNETSPFELRFESGDGKPIAGVSAFPFKRVDHRGAQHSVYFSSAKPIIRKSNATGKIPMPHFLPGEQVTIYVRFPEGDWQQRQLTVPIGESTAVLNPVPKERFEDG